MALYRAGQYQEAIDTLIRSVEMNETAMGDTHPSDWAFIAMARWQLGEKGPSRDALATLRELASEDSWKDDAETQAWLREAEELIRPEP